MTPQLPFCCPLPLYNIILKQERMIDTHDALLHCAGAIKDIGTIGVYDTTDLNDSVLQEHTDKIRSRVRSTSTQAVLAHLHDYLFEECKFTGNQNDFFNPQNCYLHSVLKTKTGHQITLSLIYKIIAERLGLHVHGVGLPGHFVVGVQDGQSILYVDTFNGGKEISQPEIIEKVKTYGDWQNEWLRPVSNRHWITRILQNLLNIFSQKEQFTNVATIIEIEMILWPNQTQLQRDLGLILARCGMQSIARQWLELYLNGNPDDPQRSDLEQLRDVLSM